MPATAVERGDPVIGGYPRMSKDLVVSARAGRCDNIGVGHLGYDTMAPLASQVGLGVLSMKRSRKFARLKRFAVDVVTHTPIVIMAFLLIVLWLLFAAGMYAAEKEADGAVIATYGQALYWGIAAFSTAGIADTPASDVAKLIGGIWIVLGSALFFGTIVATITAYFMRPLRRPVRQIVDTIEYNLEQLDDLSVEELEVLKSTTDALIMQMERHRKKEERHEKQEKK